MLDRSITTSIVVTEVAVVHLVRLVRLVLREMLVQRDQPDLLDLQVVQDHRVQQDQVDHKAML
jgi:hypothetical protein